MATSKGNIPGASEKLRGKISSPGSMKGALRGLEKIHGYSAYQVAVINGFEGTEEEWLESLHGKDGHTPQKGVDYFDGQDGYTPKKGVDYWTPAEQEAVAGATKAANDAASGAEAAANHANTAAWNANQAAQSANTAVQAAGTATGTANAAAENANRAGSAANTAAGNANQAAETANTAAGAANAAAQSASNAETELRNAAAAGAFDGDTGPAGVVYGPDEPTDPSHPVWIDTSGNDENPYLMADQGVENAGKILGIGTDGKVGPVDAPEGGGSEIPGENGGYYTPSVTQVDRDTIRLGFAPSKEDMPAVNDVEVNLPEGPKGSDATVTAENIQAALGYTPADAKDVGQLSAEKLNKAGWNANKYLGTNETGAVVERNAPEGTSSVTDEQFSKLKSRVFEIDGDLGVEFEQGGLSGSDFKTENTSSYWIRSKGYVKRELIKSASVNTDEGYSIRSYHYDANMNYVGVNTSGVSSPVTAGVYVRILIAHGSGITPESDHGFSVVSTANDLKKQIETTTDDLRKSNCIVEMEQGSLTHSGGAEADANHYIRNKGYIPYNSVYKLTANSEYGGYVFLYDADKKPIDVLVGASYCARLPAGFREYEIPYIENAAYVRFSIQNSGGTAILPSDNHGVRVCGFGRYRYDRGLVVRNFLEQIKQQLPIASACVGTTGGAYYKTNFGAVCITDLHGVFYPIDDAYQVQQHLKVGNEAIDLPILNTGDMFAGVAKSNGAIVAEYSEYIQKAISCGVYHTIGQHEVGFYDTTDGRSKANCLTHDEVFVNFISPMKEIWGLPNLATNYYYKDFVASKVRLISLYQYNIPLVEETSDVWAYPRSAIWYGQEQLNWLVETLASTPDDYRVIVLAHQPEKDVVKTEGNTFFSGERVAAGNTIIDGTPIVDIIEAFIAKNSISKTYVCKDKARYPESDFSNHVEADFGRAKGIFSCYITGDAHVDYIGSVDGTNQKNIGLTSSGQSYDMAVIRRSYGTVASVGNNPESSIVTVLGYDFSRSLIRIGRLGQQFASDGKTRMYAAINY